jgi:hypothetical protein
MYATDDADVRAVLAQAPANATREDVRVALTEAAGDIADAIAILWRVPPPPPPLRSDEQKVWDRIRAHSDEMTRARGHGAPARSASAPPATPLISDIIEE